MFKIIFFIFLSLSFANSYAFDPKLLSNNKESISRILTSSHHARANEWARSFRDRPLALLKAKAFLGNILKKMETRSEVCDLGMIDLMMKAGLEDNTLRYEEDLLAVSAFLRIENQIDDLFFENILNSEDLIQRLEKHSGRRYPRLGPINSYNDHTRDVDLASTYQDFKTWPDDVSKCSLNAYYKLSVSLTWKDVKERDRILKRLNYLAVSQNIISTDTYYKLEVFRETKALDWPTHVANYMDIIKNAKDKLSPTGKPEMDPASHSTKFADRKKKVTHRERLYKNFSSTQVMILAGIIEKTAKRMDSRNVSINWQYGPLVEVSEIYVLSPMEKYRLSLKMLKKDIAETMRSDMFSGRTIEYEDLVTAAYETGYIKSDELELILRFEDFWNPQTPKWKTYANFAFSLVGTATWFLPAPFNIVGALALVITQTKVMSSDQKPDADDNWNVII